MAREAVELYRGWLFPPQAYMPDLAGSLNNLANRLSAVVSVVRPCGGS